MLLSDTDIKNQLQAGTIVISPFIETNLRSASYRYTLGNILSKPVANGKVIDIRENSEMSYESFDLTQSEYVLQPGEFLLGQIAESISLAPNIGSFTDGRTQLARLGVEVVMNSMFVEPGQKGSHETLEICNSGPNPVLLYAGMPIAKGIFFFMQSPTSQPYSEYGTYAYQNSPEPILGEEGNQ